MKKIIYLLFSLLIAVSCAPDDPLASLADNNRKAPDGRSGTSLDNSFFYVKTAPAESIRDGATNAALRQIEIEMSKEIDTATATSANIILRDVSTNPAAVINTATIAVSNITTNNVYKIYIYYDTNDTGPLAANYEVILSSNLGDYSGHRLCGLYNAINFTTVDTTRPQITDYRYTTDNALGQIIPTLFYSASATMTATNMVQITFFYQESGLRLNINYSNINLSGGSSTLISGMDTAGIMSTAVFSNLALDTDYTASLDVSIYTNSNTYSGGDLIQYPQLSYDVFQANNYTYIDNSSLHIRFTTASWTNPAPLLAWLRSTQIVSDFTILTVEFNQSILDTNSINHNSVTLLQRLSGSYTEIPYTFIEKKNDFFRIRTHNTGSFYMFLENTIRGTNSQPLDVRYSAYGGTPFNSAISADDEKVIINF
ncbi:MAG TPA: Ig-like domain-containing protein [Spirochaetota bacterium]|nr:Ig-like domain-containing protein [Spirochaetota bacterium]